MGGVQDALRQSAESGSSHKCQPVRFRRVLRQHQLIAAFPRHPAGKPVGQRYRLVVELEGVNGPLRAGGGGGGGAAPGEADGPGTGRGVRAEVEIADFYWRFLWYHTMKQEQ